MSKHCPCGSEVALSECCLPYIKGSKACLTAETLMRSRYTAYTLSEMDYIVNTHDVRARAELDFEAAKKWAKDSDWKGLEIISVVDGGEGDKQGSVEFKAFYSLNDQDHVLHEVSHFNFKQGEWFYSEGSSPSILQYTRDKPKVGRNEACPCESGKKYKKCCGKN